MENINRIPKIAQQRTQMDFGCRDCLLRNNCGRGCMANAFNINGNPYANDEDYGFRKLKFLYHDLPRIDPAYMRTVNLLLQ